MMIRIIWFVLRKNSSNVSRIHLYVILVLNSQITPMLLPMVLRLWSLNRRDTWCFRANQLRRCHPTA